MTAIELDEAGKSMWQETIDAWGDQKRHDRFVQHCLSSSLLVAAAGLYGAYRLSHPGDETARRMQERVVFLSTQRLASTPRRSGPVPLVQSPWFVAIVVTGAVAGAILGLVCGMPR